MYAFICPFNSLCIKMTELTAVFVGVEDGSVDIEEEDGSDDIMEECEKDPLITTSQSTIGKRSIDVLKWIKNPNFAVSYRFHLSGKLLFQVITSPKSVQWNLTIPKPAEP